jgi:hypothetical protein
MAWTLFNGMNNPPFRAAAMDFVRAVSSRLRKPGQGNKKELILAVPPPMPSRPGAPHIDPAHMLLLDDVVDRW